ncbi:MAG: FHA domain-containing protein [Cystobacterineae bacterium]|nr:FHA domain-containing protein [Cystobacterineae bacterium]
MASLLLNNLGIICQNCDFLNPAASRQCLSCAQSLPEAPAITPPPLSPLKATPSSSSLQVPTPPQAPSQTPTQPSHTSPPASLLPPSPLPHVDTPGAMLYAATHTYPTPPQAYPPPQVPHATAPTPQRLSLLQTKPYTLLALSGTYRGQRFALYQKMQIGRTRGQLLFSDDPFVSPAHASLWLYNQKVFVRDEGSVSGVYVSIPNKETISAQQKFCVGMRLFRYLGQLPPTPPYIPGRLVIHGTPVPVDQPNYAIEEILIGDRPGRTFISAGPSIFIGSTKCDLSYSLDEGMAPRHCELTLMPQSAMLCDLSNGLGTYVRIAGDRLLSPGDRLRIGQQILQLEAPL